MFEQVVGQNRRRGGGYTLTLPDCRVIKEDAQHSEDSLLHGIDWSFKLVKE